MAKLIPDVPELTADSRAEVEFYRALKMSLSDEFHVYHSVAYLLGPDRSSRPAREGEIDFLIAHADLGLLAIEVKGGGIEYCGREQSWKSLGNQGRTNIQDPFRQGQRGIKRLIHMIEDRGVLRGEVEFAHGHAVAFPQCTFESYGLPTHCNPGVIIDERHLGSLEDRIRQIFAFWRKNRPVKPLTVKGLRKIEKQVLAPEFRLAQSLGARFRAEDAGLLRLTAEQGFCLDFLERNGSALVEGSAGTGKTVLALDYAQRLADRGLDVLLLCFNRLLGAAFQAASLERGGAAGAGSLWGGYYHGLCLEWARRAGIEVQLPDEGADPHQVAEFWNDETSVILLEAIEKVSDRFDAIVVDEAQDFRPEWWETVDALWKAGGEKRLALFSDPLQNIYQRPPLPQDFPVLPLLVNCRNTREIAEYAAAFVDAPFRHSSWAVPGEAPSIQKCKSREDARKKLDAIVSRLIEQSIRPEQIALLSTHRYGNSTLSGVCDVAGVPVEEMEDDWMRQKRGRVRFSTLHRFKGLDSDVVIFLDVDGSRSASPSHQYVAASRAKHRLFVLEMV
ncbi:MAG: NERD domain-containing protein [Armatimonadetes bacterium]|nr:NERD domain-containing protein [Armatimonadota bacterium]